MNMNIVLVQASPYLGVSSTAYNGYAQALSEIGQHVSVICVASDKTNVQSDVKTIAGVDVYEWNGRIASKYSFGMMKFRQYCKAVLTELDNKRKIDVCQIKAFPNTGIFILPPLSRPHIKYCLDVRSCAIRNRFNFILSKITIKLQSKFFDHTFVLGEDLKNLLFGAGKVDQAISAINLGVNTSNYKIKHYSELDSPTVANKIKFVYVGAMGNKRNVIDFVKAFLRVRLENSQISLSLVGSGAQVAAIQHLAEKLNVSDAINYIGSVPHERIPHILADCDVGVAYVPNTPEFADQPPTKTIEYMAAGLVVLATDTAGNRQFVSSGKNGFLHGDSEEDSFLAIKKLVETEFISPDRIKQLSLAASETAKVFDYKSIAKNELQPIYKALLMDRND